MDKRYQRFCNICANDFGDTVCEVCNWDRSPTTLPTLFSPAKKQPVKGEAYKWYLETSRNLRNRANTFYDTFGIPDAMLINASDAIRELLQRWPNWINNAERHPEPLQTVLAVVSTAEGREIRMLYHDGKGCYAATEGAQVLYWMRLPDMPVEDHAEE